MRRDLVLTAGGIFLLVASLLPFHRVFTTDAWVPEAFGALLAALAVAVVARRLRLHAAVSAGLSVVGFAFFATVLYAGEAGPWPTFSALDAVWDLASQGLAQIQDQPAPTEPLDGLRLLVAVEVWTVTHLTLEVLVRLRRPGLALMSAATLWLTPLVVPIDGSNPAVNALPFFLASGLVLLLDPSADDVGWTAESRPLLPSWLGVTLAGVATAASLLAPVVVPGYDAAAVLDVTTSSDPRGYQPIVDVGDRLQLPQPRDVLRVTSSERLYLRLAALNTFDGRTWRLGPPDVETYRPDPDDLFRADGNELPLEAPIAEGSRVSVGVEVLDLENIYVPVPYQVVSVDGPDDAGLFYSLDGGFVATGDVSDNELSGQTRVGVREGFTYSVEAVVPTPDYEDLAALGDLRTDPNDPALQLPQQYGQLAAIAEQVYADAGAATTIDRTLALQDWFIGPESTFTYSVNVPGLRGDDALIDFVTNSQTGYCEYFATAMAVMLRATGIPARVSVGFLPGAVSEPARAPGEPAQFTVSTSDAHAWVEVLFPDFGWVRMDPTPRGGGLPPTQQDLNPQPPLSERNELTDDLPSAAPETEAPSDEPFIPDPTIEPDAAAGGGGAPIEIPTPVLVLLLVLLASGAVVALVYGWPRIRQWQARDHGDPRDRVLQAQRRLLATAAHLGVGRRPAETLDDLVARWVADELVTEPDGRRFATLVAAAAFGDRADEASADEVRQLEQRMLAGLGATLPRRQRLVAPWRDAYDRTRDRVSRG